MIEVNLRRRHLNEFQRGLLGFILEGIESEMARQRREQSKFKPDTGKLAADMRWKEVWTNPF
ncbi:MAG: hypothetical protein WAM14_16075 [Candidatus Nitrosopolaris sp.]